MKGKKYSVGYAIVHDENFLKGDFNIFYGDGELAIFPTKKTAQEAAKKGDDFFAKVRVIKVNITPIL